MSVCLKLASAGSATPGPSLTGEASPSRAACSELDQLMPGDTLHQGELNPGSDRALLSLELWGPLASPTLPSWCCSDLQQGTW